MVATIYSTVWLYFNVYIINCAFYSLGVVMEAKLPLSDVQSSASLASDQGLSVVVFSNDHPSTHGSDVKLDMTQSDKRPPRQKSASSLHGITVTPYKLVLIAGIIFIIALFSIPIILYYSLNDSPPDSSQRFINISKVAKMMFKKLFIKRILMSLIM